MSKNLFRESMIKYAFDTKYKRIAEQEANRFLNTASEEEINKFILAFYTEKNSQN